MDKMIPLHCIFRLMSKKNLYLVNNGGIYSLNQFCQELEQLAEEELAKEQSQELGDPEREVWF